MNHQQHSKPQFTPRKKMFLNDWRQPHPATDKPLEGAKFPAQFMWEITNAGKIVFKVSDGIFKEGGGGKNNHKEVEMTAYDRNILFETLLEASNSPDFTSKQYQIKKHDFVFTGGQSRLSDSPVTKGTFTIKRDENGVISLGYSKGDYKVMCNFKGPNSNVLLMRNAEGQMVEDTGFMSRMSTRSWVNFHRPVLDRMELDGWEPPKPKGDGSAGSHKPNNNPNHSNTNSFDDDFDDMF